MATLVELQALDVNSFYTGSLLPRADSVGVAQSTSTPSLDRTHVIDDSNPSTNQGIGTVDWDAMQQLPIVPPPAIVDHDASRYRKSYAACLQQPRRVRLYRRGT